MGAFGGNVLASRLRRPVGAAPLPVQQPMPVPPTAQPVMPAQPPVAAQPVMPAQPPVTAQPMPPVGTPAPAPPLPGAPVAGMSALVAAAPPLASGLQSPAPGAIAPPQQPMQNAWLQRLQQGRGMQAM